MKAFGVRAILCPTAIHGAVKEKNGTDVGAILDYTLMWNLFNVPCGVVPVTLVREDEYDY